MGLISRVSSRTYRREVEQATMLVTPEQFVEKLKILFYENRAKGPVTVTMKRYDGIDKPEGKVKQSLLSNMTDAEKSKRKVLIRAKTNKKKLATVIDKEKLGEFQTEYSKMLRSSMDGLKKRVKKKKIVQQQGQQAKKVKK